MAKWANTLLADAGLSYLSANSNKLMIGTAQPASYANANSYALGTLADTSGNWSLAAGDVNGRKITHAAATVAIGTSGTVDHIYFVNTGGSGTLLFVGTCTPTAVTASGTLILNAWDVDEIGDPT